MARAGLISNETAAGASGKPGSEDSVSSDERSGATRRLAVFFVGLAVALTAVWVVGAVSEEVYPATVFPAFGRIPSGDTDQRAGYVKALVVETTERSTELTLDEAFDGAPDSFHLPMVESLVDARPSGDLRAWIRARIGPIPRTDCVVALEVVEMATADPADRDLVSRLDFGSCPTVGSGT